MISRILEAAKTACLTALFGVTLLPSLSFASVASEPDTGKGPAPNILVILLDDVGPEQLQCYDPAFSGGPNVMPGTNLYLSAYPYAPTPNISSLAREGIRFTRGFTSPICSPSRAMLMTGRYSFRNQIGQVILTSGETQGIEASLTSVQTQLLSRIPQIPDREVLLPEMIGVLAGGYARGLFGKWHLTSSPCSVQGHLFPPSLMGFPNPIPIPYGVSDVDGEDHPINAGWPEFRGMRGNIGGKPNVGTERCAEFLPQRATSFAWPYAQTKGSQMPGWVQCSQGMGVPFLPTCLVPLVGIPPALPSPLVTPFLLSETVSDFEKEFLTTTIRGDVEEFVLAAEDKGNPWLAVWTPQACHKPFTWPPQDLHDFGGPPPLVPNPSTPPPASFAPEWRPYKALLQSFDTELGRLKNALSADPNNTIWERTVVILLGDNGTPGSVIKEAERLEAGGLPGLMAPYIVPPDYSFDSSIPLHQPEADPSQSTRFKGSPYVSGSNMICIVSGAGVVAPGRTYGGLVDMVDIFSTIRELVGVPQDWPATWVGQPTAFKIDGVSLCPVLQNASGVSPRMTSLALLFSPNGPFDNSPGGDTRVLCAGYAKEIPGDGIYTTFVSSGLRAREVSGAT